MFDKAKSAFRVGSTTGTQWDEVNIGQGSIAMGANAIASQTDCVAIGTTTTANNSSCTAIGGSSLASGNGSFAIGSGQATSTNATALRGAASGTQAISLWGAAGGQQSTAIGVGALTSRYTQVAFAGANAFSTGGDGQTSLFCLSASTSNGTATELALGNAAGNWISMGTSRTMAFQIRLAAHRTDVSGTAAAWPLISGGITKDSSGNPRILGSIVGAGVTTISDAGAATWSVSVTAETTSGTHRLAVTVTGEAAKTIRWVASVVMAEVG